MRYADSVINMNLRPLYEYYHNRSAEEHNKMERIVAASLMYVVGHYFASVSNNFVLTITYRWEHNATSAFFNVVLDQLFADWNDWPLQIVNVQRIAGQMRVEAHRQYNLILTDSYESFLKADLHSYSKDNGFNEFYFIFLHQSDAVVDQDMQKIFEYCWQHNLIHCAIEIQNGNGDLFVYTYYPFTELACNQVKIFLINQYNGTSMGHGTVFPKKLKNMHGCTLKAASWNVPPYVFLSTNSTGHWTITGGLEGMLLMELSNRMNFTMEIHVPPNNEQRGIKTANGVLTGALKMLHNREVDFSFGGFRESSDRNEIATSTINYHQSTMSVAAISAIYRLTSVQILLYPFGTILWILILFVLFLAIGVARNVSMSTMDTLRMLIGMGPIYQPKRFVPRLFNISWMTYTLLIRTIYQALVFHLLRTHVTTNVPRSIDELPQRGYTMVMMPPAWELIDSVTAFNSIKKLRLNSSSDYDSLEFLGKLSLEEAKMYVVASPKDFIKYYMLHRQTEGDFSIFPFDLMLFKVCIYLTKHSYLIEQFDEFLIRFQSAGLIEGWYRQLLGGSNTMKRHNHRDRPFGLAHMKVAFHLLVFCLIVSFLVFILELLYYQINKKK